MKLIELLLAADALGFSAHSHEGVEWTIWRARGRNSSFPVTPGVRYKSEAAAWDVIFRLTIECLPPPGGCVEEHNQCA